MKTIKLSQRQIDNLEPYNIPNGISNTEGTIYKLKTGKKSIDEQDLLFKRLYITQDRLIEDEEYGFIYTNNVSNKYNTISRLGDYGNTFNMNELAIPQHQVEVRGEVVGFTVQEIKNSRPLLTINEDTNTLFEDKINYLKQVGELLRKIQRLNKNDINFFIHDLHEANILVDEEKKIHLVDLDSATFSKETALPSKYISTNKNLRKYDCYKFNRHDIPYPSENGDLYCYTIMILNTLYNDNVSKLSENEFYDYLSYLTEIKYDYKFIDTLAQIYRNGDNINPVDYLDNLDNNKIGRANKSVYQYIRSKK